MSLEELRLALRELAASAPLHLIEHPGHPDQKVHGRRNKGGQPYGAPSWETSPYRTYTPPERAVREGPGPREATIDQYAGEILRTPDRESGVLFDGKGQVLTVSSGSSGAVSPPWMAATKSHTLLHNHPGGAVYPSQGDARYAEAARLKKLVIVGQDKPGRTQKLTIERPEGLGSGAWYDLSKDLEGTWSYPGGSLDKTGAVVRWARNHGFTVRWDAPKELFESLHVDELTALAEHPGHPDQKVHGRRYASSTRPGFAGGEVVYESEEEWTKIVRSPRLPRPDELDESGYGGEYITAWYDPRGGGSYTYDALDPLCDHHQSMLGSYMEENGYKGQLRVRAGKETGLQIVTAEYNNVPVAKGPAMRVAKDAVRAGWVGWESDVYGEVKGYPGFPYNLTVLDLLEAQLIEHPGHGDQKVHGRRYGGAGYTVGLGGQLTGIAARARDSGTLDAFKVIHNAARGHDEAGSVADALNLDSVTDTQIRRASKQIAKLSQEGLKADGYPETFSVWRAGKPSGVASVTTDPGGRGTFGPAQEYKVNRSDVLTYGNALQKGTFVENELHVEASKLEPLSEARELTASAGLLIEVALRGLALGLREHLPGQHDQRSHGRRGSVGGPANAESFEPNFDSRTTPWNNNPLTPQMRYDTEGYIKPGAMERGLLLHNDEMYQDLMNEKTGWHPTREGPSQQQLAEAREELRARAREDGREHLRIWDENGEVLCDVTGTESHVSMYPEIRAQGHTSMHTHPHDVAFSNGDINTEGAYNMKRTEVITPERVHSIEVAEGAMLHPGVGQAYEQVVLAHPDWLPEGQPSNRAMYEGLKYISREMDYKIRYTVTPDFGFEGESFFDEAATTPLATSGVY